ncbi:MAG: efflux transporter periplasmic adaptor subunit [Rhodobacteraceae bacterium]|nr:efflux transporter periplasmic adaptor subunit [Paracoccaceae bacterium]
MRFLRQSLVGLVLTAVTLALLVAAVQIVASAVQTRLAEERRAPPARERVFTVNLVTAQYETVVPLMQAFGEVQSDRTLELRSAQAGRVVALSDNFREGGTVRAGELLVRIDPADARADLSRARSDLQDARAEARDAARALELARDEQIAAEDQAALRLRAYQRQVDLAERGVGTAAAVETAELAAASARQAVLARRQAVAQAEARVDQAATRTARAELALADARRDLSETEIRADFDGMLGEVTLVEGRLVSLNEKIAALIDPDALEVAFRVSTQQYARLLDADGALIPAPVTVTLEGAGAGLITSGRIARGSASTGSGQTGRLIFAGLDRAAGFKPGDFVTVSVQEPELSEVARLPATALGAGPTVLALGADDRLEALPVTLLRRQGDDVLVRGAGLNGREVVTGRTPLLGAGIKVRPFRAVPAASADTATTTGAAAETPEMLELTAERRARLVAMVEASRGLPAEAKAQLLARLESDRVPARMVERIESRLGG